MLTDHPWPDAEIETAILEHAGFELQAGPGRAGTAKEIEALIAAHDPVAIMTCWAEVSPRAVTLPSNLRVIARMGVGLDNIAVEAASARGAWVVNVPDYCVEEVSDHAVTLLLDHWRGVTALDRESKRGLWEPSEASARRVRNMTVGIFGYGRIGAATARKLANGFKCRVLVNSRGLMKDPGPDHELGPGILTATSERVQREADAVVLHLPLTPATRHFIDAEFLAACERKPVLVNVSRGGLVDNQALLQALEYGQLSAAALDVVEGEPAPSPKIIGRPDVIATPHIAFLSDASLEELRRRSSEDVVRVLRGDKPLNPCNVPRVAG